MGLLKYGLSILSIFGLLTTSFTLAPLSSQAAEWSGVLEDRNICIPLSEVQSKHISYICIKSYAIRWRLYTIFGSPVRNFTMKWEIGDVIGLRAGGNNSRLSAAAAQPETREALQKIRPTKVLMRAYVKLAKSAERNFKPGAQNQISITFDPGILKSSGGGSSYNVAGSPAWNKLFTMENYNFNAGQIVPGSSFKCAVRETYGSGKPVGQLTLQQKFAYMREKYAKEVMKSGAELHRPQFCNISFSGLGKLNKVLEETCDAFTGERKRKCLAKKKKKEVIKKKDDLEEKLEGALSSLGKKKPKNSKGKHAGAGALDDIEEIWEKKRKMKAKRLAKSASQYLGSIKTLSQTISVTAWDHGKEDGDRVSVRLNNKIVIRNWYLTNSKRTYTMRLSPGQNSLEIKALNQGSSGLNTASFRIKAGDKVLAEKKWNLRTGQNAVLLVVKIP